MILAVLAHLAAIFFGLLFLADFNLGDVKRYIALSLPYSPVISLLAAWILQPYIVPFFDLADVSVKFVKLLDFPEINETKLDDE